MKRLFALFTCFCVLLVSCDESMKEQNMRPESGKGSGADANVESPATGGSGTNSQLPESPLPPASNPLAPAEQKAKLENVSKKVLEELPAAEYEELIKLAARYYEFGSERFDNDEYDMSEVEEALKNDLLDKVFSEIETGDETMETILRLSECKGTIYAREDKAVYQKSNDTKIVVEDTEGDWVLELKQTGWKKNVYLGEFDGNSVTVDIPSQVTAELSVGRKSYLQIEINVDYNFGSNGIDPENDRISFTTTFQLADLSLTIGETACNAKSGEAEFSMKFKKGRTTWVGTEFTLDADLEFDEDDDIESLILNMGSFSVELMDEVKIVGVMADRNGLIEDIAQEELYFEGTEDQVKATVDAINSSASVCISYDGGRTSQARVVMDYFEFEDNPGEYYCEPVILFEDGTSYSYFEFYEMFIEDDLDDMESDLADAIQEYEDLVEKYFDL